MPQDDHDRRVDYVEFPATDLDPIKAFYTQAFGWKFTDYGPTYSSFEDGRLTGGFTTAAKMGIGGTLVVIYAVDLEAVQTSIRQSGGSIVKEIFEFPGGRRLHFTDPSGNELAVWSDK
jgi:hypothetical protein